MKCRENMKIDYKGSAKLIFDFFVEKKDMDVEDKLELLKLKYKLMKEALEKLLNQLEIERQEGKYQLRFGNEEYEMDEEEFE